jgi:NitT/TauT family transport system substrate-binding protein
MHMSQKTLVLIVLMAAALVMSACAAEPAPEATEPAQDTEAAPDVPTLEPTPEATSEAPPAGEEGTLKVALLPILDSLPFFVAEANGYFIEEGVVVEAVPVGSALERDQLMQSGEIDGMLNEMHSTAIFNREGTRLQVVMTSRKAYPDAPLFRVLAAPRSNITIPSDLAGVPIGISENTIIEYVTDRLLEAEGLSSDDIVGQSVPAIPERFQLLMQGQILAATLPDPLAQSAIEQGAIPIVDDSAYPEYAVSVLTFNLEAIQGKPEALRGFLRAWDRAAADINADPEAYRALLLERVSIPPNVQETYAIPPFPRAEVPSAEQWDDVMQWLIDKGLIEQPLAYGDSVTTGFLP